MNRTKIFIIVLASLLFGLAATLGTSHNVRRNVPLAANCGYSVDGRTGAHVTLTDCQLSRYGWPRPYLMSDMQIVLRDYHLPTTGQLNQVTGSVATAHLEVGALLLDILAWAVAGYVLGAAVVFGVKRSRAKTSAKPAARNTPSA